MTGSRTRDTLRGSTERASAGSGSALTIVKAIIFWVVNLVSTFGIDSDYTLLYIVEGLCQEAGSASPSPLSAEKVSLPFEENRKEFFVSLRRIRYAQSLWKQGFPGLGITLKVKDR